MYHEYVRWTGTWISNGDIAVFSRIWTCSGLIRGDPKFGQGLGYIAALQVKGLRVYGVSVTFMSTGYMYHRYDLRTGDWMMILISTGDVTVSSPFNTKHTYRCVCVCVCVCDLRRLVLFDETGTTTSCSVLSFINSQLECVIHNWVLSALEARCYKSLCIPLPIIAGMILQQLHFHLFLSSFCCALVVITDVMNIDVHLYPVSVE